MKQYFTKHTSLSILLLLLLACHPFLMAQSLAYVQQNKPDLEAKNAPNSNLIRLKDALNELSQEYQVSILFEDVTVKGLQATVDKIKGGKLESKLEKLLKPHRLTFQKVNKNAYVVVAPVQKNEKSSSRETRKTENNSVPTLLKNTPERNTLLSVVSPLQSAPLSVTIPDKTITGKVTDATGEALPGTNVLVKGTTIGDITDVNGEFRVDVPDENSILVFSFTGFVSQEIVVGNQTTINVTLKQDDLLLNEVVVVGYGEIKKSDLTGAVAKLPVTATNYGRITKGAAQFLLARVYLTRGWNFKNSLGGSPADFDLALQYADKVIDAYPLATNYNQLFPTRSENPLKQYTGAQNDKNPEIIFAVQYNTDVLTNKTDPAFTVDAAGGNNLHSVFNGSGEGFPGSKGRTSDYNRSLGFHNTTPAMYRLYDPENDSRYDHNFLEVGYAMQAVAGFKPLPTVNPNLKIDIKAGDTVVYYRPWNKPATTLAERGIDMGGKKNYSVVNPEEWGGGYGFINGSTVNVSGFPSGEPHMWKFWQPGIPYGDAYGTFNEAVFRSAEAYLIAAEAIVKGAKGGKLGGAEVYYNRVLDRALGAKKGNDPRCALAPENVKSLETVSYRATAANITIDLILDERARELMGEYSRWFDLKRTGKLVERVKKYNPWAAKSGTINDVHYLRPIPQAEIDLSFPAMTQNAGY